MSESLYGLLQRAADEHGGRTAIEFADRRLTYRELLAAAERTASLLARHGAAPGAQVAFCFRKSIAALTTLFGIIRTGAAYVPLDPDWPARRIKMICDDAGIRLWTGTRGPPAAASIHTAVVDEPDADSIALSTANDCRPLDGDAPDPRDDMANVLFTSGSTGRPKGVQITTRSLMHFSGWAVETFGLTPDDRIANHAPYHFDLSTLDIFAAVRAGATMIPVPERLKMFPYPMAKFIAERRISVWYSVPSALAMMQLRGRLADHDLSRLRHVIFAGEVMPKPTLQALAREVPQATYTNLYGPTETNACTWHRVGPGDLADEGPLPIGVPISQTRVWIVDENLREAADGESGELLVAGPTLTSGYFGDVDLTDRRLIPAPNGIGTAYRTGDRVRRRADGALMFEGRIDRMIKCRGHRIEPGEIEAVLARCPGVKEAAVVPLPDPLFGNRIRACVSARDGARLTEEGLSAFCRANLPAYMAPDVWHILDALPRTDRGKIDLQALMA